MFLQGVGNTLKRHYETYLLEYELAHDDVDGECCLLCHRFVNLFCRFYSLTVILGSLAYHGICNCSTVVQQGTG